MTPNSDPSIVPNELAKITEADFASAQTHITAFWSEVAKGYEAHGGNVATVGSPEYQRWLEVLESILPEPPSDLLDVACGTGYVSLAAASLGHRVTAIDLAPAMLDELLTNAVGRDLAIDARLGDAVTPAFPAATFDVLTNRHFLWTLRDPEQALFNWYQVLRPGGRFVAVDGFWFTEWDEHEVPALFAEHYTEETRGSLPFMHLDGVEPIFDMLTKAGFVQLSVEPRPDLSLGRDVPFLITARRP